MQDLEPSQLDKLDDKCPFLGLLHDITTYTDFPSDMNYCRRSKPVSLPSFKQQRDVCLTHNYLSCPLILDKELKRLPVYLAKPLPSPHRKRNIILASILIVILLWLAAFFFGWANGINTAVQSFFDQMLPPQNTVDVSMLTYSTRTPTISPSLAPTKTLTPTRTIQPTKTRTPTYGIYVTLTYEAAQALLSPTSTPECSFLIENIGYSFLNDQRIMISYTTPLDLTNYLVLDALGQPTKKLELPEFKFYKNGFLNNNYGTYLYDPDNPQRLFLEFDPVAGDVYEFDFLISNGRYCSDSFTAPRNPSP